MLAADTLRPVGCGAYNQNWDLRNLVNPLIMSGWLLVYFFGVWQVALSCWRGSLSTVSGLNLVDNQRIYLYIVILIPRPKSVG